MGAFLRFTLLVGALVAAAAIGYAVGLSRSERFATASNEQMTIDTGGSPEPRRTRSSVEAPPPPAPAEPAPESPPAAPAPTELDAPTSIDDILQRQVTPAPPAG